VACRLCNLALDNVTEERRALQRDDSETICFRISLPAMKLLQRVAESHCATVFSRLNVLAQHRKGKTVEAVDFHALKKLDQCQDDCFVNASGLMDIVSTEPGL